MNLLKHQIVPDGNWWDIWYLRGDRACGKTVAGIEYAKKEMSKGYPVIWIGAAGLREYILDDVLKDKSLTYSRMSNIIKSPTGGSIYFFSDSTKPERLRGPQFATAIWDDVECTQEKYAREMLQPLQWSLRIGEKPRMMFTSSEDVPEWLIPHLMRNNVAYTRGSVKDNIPNLAPSFVAAHLSI
jgi:phage terminase large subunit-like protein